MTDLIFSRKSKTDNSIKGKTKGHVLLVIDLFCLMFYFGFVFDYDCLKGGNSKSLSNHNDERQRKQLFDRIGDQKKEETFVVLWSPTP